MLGQIQRSFARQKRTFSGDIDEVEPDIKVYRFLMSLLAHNLNTFSRSNRDVLGDIQILPKIKISREEQYPINQQLQRVFKKMQQKICRDAISKNAYLKKGYEQYANHYHNNNLDKEYKSFVQSFQTISNQKNKFTTSPSKKNNIVPSTYNPVKRPLSSKIDRNQKSEKSAVVVATIDKAFNQFNQQVAQIFKMKTITHHQVPSFNPQQKNDRRYLMTQRGTFRQEFAKARRNLVPRKENKESQLNRYQQQSSNVTLNGNQIIICDRRPKTQEQRQNSQNNSGTFRGKYSNKRIMSIKMAHRKSIDEIERMQIQNKLMMINSAMTVNPTQSQGYKAKTKCWQNYFN